MRNKRKKVAGKYMRDFAQKRAAAQSFIMLFDGMINRPLLDRIKFALMILFRIHLRQDSLEVNHIDSRNSKRKR